MVAEIHQASFLDVFLLLCVVQGGIGARWDIETSYVPKSLR